MGFQVVGHLASIIGPSLLVISPKRPLDQATASELLEIVGNNERFILWETEDQKQRYIGSLVDPRSIVGVGRWDWEPWTEVGRNTPVTYVPFSKMDRWRLEEINDTDFLFEGKRAKGIMLCFGRFGSRYMGPFPDHDKDKRDFLLEVWEKVANCFQPKFAVMDDFGLNVRKRRQKDLSAYAWGVTIYGPDLVERIGRDRIMSSPAFLVKELPWGAFWVQASENPFQPSAEKKKELEKYLNLKQLPLVVQ
jgi:hypothetical protein